MRLFAIVITFAIASPGYGQTDCPTCRPAMVAQAFPPLAPLTPTTNERDAALKPGDVFIPHAYRIRNSNRNCVWCAIETVCKQAGIPQFDGIKERAVRTGWHGASMRNVMAALDAAGVGYKYQYPSREHSRDVTILQEAIAEGTGAYIEIPGHALVVCGIDDKGVRVIDNGESQSVEQWSRAYFHSKWTGAACFPRRPIKPKPNSPHPPLSPNKPPETVPVPDVVPPAPVSPDTGLSAKLDKLLEQQAETAKQLAELRDRPALPGPAGKDGKPGEPGIAGPPGPQGPQGKDGTAADASRIVHLESRITVLERALTSQPVATRIIVVPVSQ